MLLDGINGQGACHAFGMDRPTIAHNELALVVASSVCSDTSISLGRASSSIRDVTLT